MFKDPDQASDGGDERLKPQCLFSANMHHEANVTLMRDLDSLTNKVRMFMLLSLVSLTVFLRSAAGREKKDASSFSSFRKDFYREQRFVLLEGIRSWPLTRMCPLTSRHICELLLLNIQ